MPIFIGRGAPQHTPSRHTPTGSKGMSEGGVMGAIGALPSAVNDALATFGVVVDRQPLSPNVSARIAARPEQARMNDIRASIAFIGLGLMGVHMAGTILTAGHPLQQAV